MLSELTYRFIHFRCIHTAKYESCALIFATYVICQWVYIYERMFFPDFYSLIFGTFLVKSSFMHLDKYRKST